ncbi:NHLP leader peptide family RiPP precursor [Paenibacillus sp.]|uniref:NHLP leader peptide family RiPP precursor n=1 Tax=Paenibacillus sp. TaxID=58172 RepID=UPI002811F323|nr:NHLP leader peptide family RiPP precursor [Paenibacillus sp.]
MSMDSLKVKIIQKAWEDPQFKTQLLSDPKSALEATFGVKLPEGIELKAVEETPTQFYLVLPPNPADLKSDGGSDEVQYVWS